MLELLDKEVHVMSLSDLIKTLESAAELATDGDAKVERYDDPRRVDRFISAPKAWIAQSVMPSSAQAIAIRHNTAAQVLSELKAQRARADLAEARVGELEAETDRVAASRECPEHPDALQMIRCTSCGGERHMPS